MLCYFRIWKYRSKGKAHDAENRREKNKVPAVWLYETKRNSYFLKNLKNLLNL